MSEIEHLISICGKKVSNLFEVRLITVYMSTQLVNSTMQ